ncbi:murein transglycosylase A [Aestuariibius insulae]|uniref:murein transglycosylase A n=1 Tax=Aestuariibius insulae TaxID=2058287 RepID=UPI00345E2F59
MADIRITQLDFSDLYGWPNDDHTEALAVFTETCGIQQDDDWRKLCDLAKRGPKARPFFEEHFLPLFIEDGTDMLFTGYFEPEIEGSLERGGRYLYPLYAMPPDIERGMPWLTRREIEYGGVLEDRGLELAWLVDPVDLFFLQIQGSGRIRLPDGTVRRVGYGGSNGHPYSSVGQELIRLGKLQPHEASAGRIRSWVRENGIEGTDLLRVNDSFVFFRPVNEVPPEKGPIGAMNRSVTAGRTIAVDPDLTPLGAPVWIEKEGVTPMRRLMIAQDTGSAIKGAQRADIFFGTGDQAGRAAGRIRDPGRMVVLLPRDRVFAMRQRLRQ